MTNAGLRLVLLALVLASTTGCFRAARAWTLRADLLTKDFAAQTFPFTPEKGSDRIGRQARQYRRHCTDTGCRVCMSDEYCVTLQREGAGSRADVSGPLPEEFVTDVWRPLDGVALNDHLNVLDARVEDRLKQDEATFEPRFGATFGVFSMLTTSTEFALGARLGLRRWLEVELLSTVAVEYTWFGNAVPHQVGVMLGVELAHWEAVSLRMANAPTASLSMFIVPTLRWGDTVQPGFRAGVGFHMNVYSARSAIPFFIELAGTGATPHGQPDPGLALLFGFGI